MYIQYEGDADPAHFDGGRVIAFRMLHSSLGSDALPHNVPIQHNVIHRLNEFPERPSTLDIRWWPSVNLQILSGTYLQDTVRSAQRTEVARYRQQYADLAEVYEGVQSVLAWLTVYTPEVGLVTPVTRDWDFFGAGYMLFNWDTFFTAYMLGLDRGSKELAYNNAIQVTCARAFLWFPDIRTKS